MANIDIILKDIEILRDRLSSLIQAKGGLLDSEVLKASILLDNALNEYNKFKPEEVQYMTSAEWADVCQ